MLGASLFPAKNTDWGRTLRVLCLHAWLCITLYQRAFPGAVCGVIAGLSDGCVSGSHLLVHETQCLCWEIV